MQVDLYNGHKVVVGWLVGRSVGRSVGWSVGRSVGWSVGNKLLWCNHDNTATTTSPI